VTPTEIHELRERLGLTQAQAARLVGVQGRSWRRWEAGRDYLGSPCAVPEPVARLLRLAERHPVVRRALEEMAG